MSSLTNMVKSNIRCVVTILLALQCEYSIAQPVFHHAGGLTISESKNGFSAWNPTGTQELLSPGVKIVFFGSASLCDAKVGTGPVSNEAHYTGRDILRDTGIAPPLGVKNDIATPVADPHHCALNHNLWRDGSFVERNTGNERGGIGLFTSVGPDANGKVPLLGIFGPQGQSGSGSNVGISGTFVVWRLDWSLPHVEALWPESTGSGSSGSSAIEIETTQTLASAALGSVSGAPNAPVKQLKQQMAVTLINPACTRALESEKRLCQIEYLFNLGIVRSGVTDWRKVDWFQSARIWIDPAQGEMPVIDGPVGEIGRVTSNATQEYALYASAGESSQHRPFTGKIFKIRIGFDQFQNALRIATAAQMQSTPKAVASENIAQYFGPMWSDPPSWRLLSVEVGQEIYNGNPDTEAHIGGSVLDIKIGPAQNPI